MIGQFRRPFSSLLLICKNLDPVAPVFVKQCPAPAYDTGCTYCEATFPLGKQIDMVRPLESSKVTIWKHLLVLNEHHPDEWPSRLENDKTSLPLRISKLKHGIISLYHPILVSTVHLPSIETRPSAIKMILYPDNQVIEIEKDLIGDDNFMKSLIQKFLSPEPQDDPLDAHISANESDLVVVCGHTQRDVRCGKLAPLIIDEFNHVLKDKNLDNKISIGTISHIGGHLFAGNVIYFNKEGNSIWYGRVTASKVQGIVEETLINGKIIQELYRGHC